MNSMYLPLNASLAKSLISSACSRLEFVDSTILAIWENMVCVALVHQLTNFITKSLLHDKLTDTSRNKKKTNHSRKHKAVALSHTKKSQFHVSGSLIQKIRVCETIV